MIQWPRFCDALQVSVAYRKSRTFPKFPSRGNPYNELAVETSLVACLCS